MDFVLKLLAGAIRVTIPIAFAALAGMLSEKVGIINMGLEGIMLFGAFFSVVGSYVTGSAWMGLLFAMAAGAITALLMAVFAIGFKCEHMLTGVAVNLLASGLTVVLLQLIWGTRGKSEAVKGLGVVKMPILKDIPIIKDLIGSISPLFYILIFFTILTWFVLYKTPSGLRIRTIGDNPFMAGSMGINVYRYQYLTMMCAGALAGLGGAYLSIGDINMFSKGMVAGRGYIALSMVIMGGWHPVWVVVCGLVYGVAQSLQFRIQSVEIPAQLVQMLPYVVTIVVLFFARSKNKAPMMEGVHYYQKGENA